MRAGPHFRSDGGSLGGGFGPGFGLLSLPLGLLGGMREGGSDFCLRLSARQGSDGSLTKHRGITEPAGNAAVAKSPALRLWFEKLSIRSSRLLLFPHLLKERLEGAFLGDEASFRCIDRFLQTRAGGSPSRDAHGRWNCWTPVCGVLASALSSKSRIFFTLFTLPSCITAILMVRSVSRPRATERQRAGAVSV